MKMSFPVSSYRIYDPNAQFNVSKENEKEFQEAKKYLITHPHHYYLFTGQVETLTDERIYQTMKTYLRHLITAPFPQVKQNENFSFGRYSALCQFIQNHFQIVTKQMGIIEKTNRN